ncbi:MAG: hypothetical protein RRZ83_01840 [Alistipes sp.]
MKRLLDQLRYRPLPKLGDAETRAYAMEPAYPTALIALGYHEPTLNGRDEIPLQTNSHKDIIFRQTKPCE